MKKFALALAATAAMVLGFGGVADAYPPGGPGITATPASGTPGYSVTVTVKCTAGETVTITLVASSTNAACNTGTAQSAVAGTAVGVVTAPNAPGTYTGSANGTTSGPLGNFTISVVPVGPATNGGTNGGTNAGGTGALPSTGSSGTNATLMLGLGALLIGGGLFGVSQIRRRQTLSA